MDRLRRISGLAIVTLVALVSAAGPAWASSVGTTPDPDVILVFRPHDDHVFSGAEEVVRGDVLSVEKGELPRLIVSPAGTLGPVWYAGVPIRLFLMKFADRDAHYPITTFPSPAPRPPAIAVSASDGLATVHAVSPGTPIVLEATLTKPDTSSPATFDVYLGVVTPGGEPLSWVSGRFGLPGLTGGAKPLPYLVDVPLYPFGLRLAYRHDAAAIPGWHTLFGLIVPAGTDPLDRLRWVSTSIFPLLVTPSGP